MTVRSCNVCMKLLPLSFFYPRGGNRSGVRARCKSCMYRQKGHSTQSRLSDAERIHRKVDGTLRSRYGIGVNEYEQMLEEQGGGCAICGGLPGARRHHVDHDHETGRVRGVLCHSCNIKLHPLESWPHLKAAQEYLSKFSDSTVRTNPRPAVQLASTTS